MTTAQLYTRTADFAVTPGGDGLTIEGYAAVFGQRTEIVDWEGVYGETMLAGSFARTLAQRGPAKVKMQFDHGHDARIGSVPIGVWEDLREDSHGLYARGRILDVPDTALVRAAIEAGAIDGMSFKFRIPDGGAVWNPTRDERTISEVALFEAGPVVWPAYEGTEVGVRGLNDALLTVCRDILRGVEAAGPDAGTLDVRTDVKAEAVHPVVVTLAERRKRALELRGVTTDEPSGTPTGATG